MSHVSEWSSPFLWVPTTWILWCKCMILECCSPTNVLYVPWGKFQRGNNRCLSHHNTSICKQGEHNWQWWSLVLSVIMESQLHYFAATCSVFSAVRKHLTSICYFLEEVTQTSIIDGPGPLEAPLTWTFYRSLRSFLCHRHCFCLTMGDCPCACGGQGQSYQVGQLPSWPPGWGSRNMKWPGSTWCYPVNGIIMWRHPSLEEDTCLQNSRLVEQKAEAGTKDLAKK